MPLLRHQPFIREQPPANIKANDDVFFCKTTKEIFTDYEKFFERTILCNSLVWTCAYTGHPGLTFQEALDSEQKAKEQLAAFPSQLKRPLLFVATLTHRSRMIDMSEDVFLFAKDRFFVGEMVEVAVGNEKKTGTITEVTTSQTGGNAERKSTEGEKRKSFGSDPSVYKYVVHLDDGQSIPNLNASQINRRRHTFTRDRCKLFLRKHCCATSSGIWHVKPKYHRQFQLSDAVFSKLCGGDPPVFAVSQAKKKPIARPTSDSEDGEFNGGLSSDEGESNVGAASTKKHKSPQQRKRKEQASVVEEPKAKKSKFDKELLKSAEEELKALKSKAAEKALLKEKVREEKLAAKQAKKDEMKKKADEEKEKRKMEKTKMKEAKKQHEDFMKQWNKIREDMECEDLKELPVPTPINCHIPTEAFGSALYVLEFIVNFKTLFDLDIPSDLSFESFSDALVSNEIDGLYFEILKEFMSAIFRHQEDEEINESDDDDDKPKEVAEILDKEVRSKSSREIVRSATICAQWPVQNFATPLRKLQLDSFTISEVVRLHLLGSGSERAPSNARFDYQQRGGYSAIDDPALDFRRSEGELLNLLAERNIFDISPGEKVKILAVLVSQLLTFATCRDHIEECAEKLKQVQRELRAHQLKETRREKDEVQYWWKKKMDERLRGHEHNLSINGDCESQHSERSSQVDAEEKQNGTKEDGRRRSRQKKQELSEKDYESMPVENIDWEKISPEERQRMKDWAKKKEAELSEEICELEFSCNMTAIGRDRTFRRYWVFRSTPGLFVEDDEQHIPDDFLQPFPQKSVITADDSIDSSRTDDVPDGDPVKSDKMEVNSCENVISSDVKMEVDNSEKDNGNHSVSDCKLTKPIQDQIATRNVVRWSVFVSQKDIDGLIESLNPRGLRESKLKQVISEQRELISELVAKCKTSTFCNVDRKPLSDDKSSPENSAEKSLEENLRDALLDIEERIFTGNLGSLKLNSRIEWRTALSGSGYSPQCESLTFGGGQTVTVHQPNKSTEEPVLGSDDSVAKIDYPKAEVSTSVVRDLSMALIQIEQMLEPKYLNPPLGEDEETKKQKQKALIEAAFKSNQKTKNDDNSLTENGDVDGENFDEEGNNIDNSAAETKRQRSPIERWEESLMSSTSLSQVYIHLSVFDMSIAWSRSSLHARCRICRRKGDGEHMLLCDACDRGHHMYCLKPPVTEVPEGDWFCPSCRPKEVVHVLRTPRKSFEVSSSDEDSDTEATEVDDEPADDFSDADNETVGEEFDTATDTEVYGNTTEDDVSTISRSTKASARKSGTTSDYRTPPCRGVERSNCSKQNGSLGRGHRSSARASANEQPRSRRSAEVPNGRSSHRPSNARHSLDPTPRRKASAEWDNYEMDAKRLSLSTKSRSGEAEHGIKIGQELVTELMHHDDAWPFLRPVTRKEASDYFDIIKHPMDFSTIRNKINRFEYNDVGEVLDDIRLIFVNCSTYNLPNSIVAIAGKQLEQHFERRVRQLKLTSDKRRSLAEDQDVVRSQRAVNRKRTM